MKLEVATIFLQFVIIAALVISILLPTNPAKECLSGHQVQILLETFRERKNLTVIGKEPCWYTRQIGDWANVCFSHNYDVLSVELQSIEDCGYRANYPNSPFQG